MSARDKLVELVLKNEPDYGNTVFVDLFGCAMSAEEMKGSVLLWLDAFKAEVLREAAEKIRSRGAAHLAFGRASWPFHEAADLIDPDKEK